MAARRLISDGFEATELDFARSITAPFFWAFSDSTGHDAKVRNGSLFFLDAGKGVFAVTAAHVVKKCLKHSEYPVFWCMIGGNGPDRIVYLQQKNENNNSINRLCDRIIGIHDGMDIATLRVSREEIKLTGCTFLTSIGSWPPDLVEANAVTYCGCPGVARLRPTPHEINFGFVATAGFAASMHERCISIQIEREKLLALLGHDLPDNFDFGGMSGGPVLEILQTARGIVWRRPAGIIFQGPNPSDDLAQSIQGLELILARPIHFINADGTLDIARWDQCNPFP
jgi:hypothetical protein